MSDFTAKMHQIRFVRLMRYNRFVWHRNTLSYLTPLKVCSMFGVRKLVPRHNPVLIALMMRTVVSTQYTSVTDGQTDGQIDTAPHHMHM